MAGLGPEKIADVVAACTAGATTSGELLGQALDTTIAVSVGEAGQFDAAAPPEGFDGAALVVLFKEQDQGAALVLPATSGLLPAWCAEPNEEQQAKLAALAEGIGGPVLGERVEIDFFKAAHVSHLGAALQSAELAESASLVPLELSAGEEKKATASLLWPLSKPDQLFAAPTATSTTAEGPDATGHLPPYMKSLMRIEIPLSVTLADSKKKVADIISLGPGAIIQFEKACDELLELRANGQLIAQGEAVKVGDKFGLEIKQIELPQERFEKLRRA